MQELKIQENKLYIGTKVLTYKYNISNILYISDKLIILFDIPENELLENIFAITTDGKVLWQVQHVMEAYPEIQKTSPFVGISLMENGNIAAANYYGLVFEISINSGKILSKQMGK